MGGYEREGIYMWVGGYVHLVGSESFETSYAGYLLLIIWVYASQ